MSEWRMQSIARDSDDSSEEEFFDAHGNSRHFASVSVACLLFPNLCPPPLPLSLCVHLFNTDQFLNHPDTQHALGLRLK